MKKIILGLIAIVLVSNVSLAQKSTANDPMAGHFFSPELVMKHQQAIDLSSDQQERISTEMKQAQSEFMDFNWKMKKISEEFILLISEPEVDESKTIERLSEMLNIENQIKKRQITLMIRIKNVLNASQQEKLSSLK